MSKQVNYTVVEGGTLSALINGVKEWQGSGWKAIGGYRRDFDENLDRHVYRQTMVKERESQTDTKDKPEPSASPEENIFEFFKKLRDAQQPLGKVFEKVLHENLEDLWTKS